ILPASFAAWPLRADFGTNSRRVSVRKKAGLESHRYIQLLGASTSRSARPAAVSREYSAYGRPGTVLPEGRLVLASGEAVLRARFPSGHHQGLWLPQPSAAVEPISRPTDCHCRKMP